MERTLLFILIIILLSIANPAIAIQENEEMPKWMSTYIIPFLPIFVVGILTFAGAWINHKYWKRKESFTRKIDFFEERLKSFLDFCKYLAEFNAYTDLLMRMDN
jgi:hypothetical protein